MTKQEINELVEKQREYYRSGATLSVKFRREMLKKLYCAIKICEAEISEALRKDLGKSAYEGFMCEVGLTLGEIGYMIKHVGKFAKHKRVRTPLAQFHSLSYVQPTPYGGVLIMSPWNYPFLLTLGPLADAIAAGNTVLLKPSAYSPATCEVVRKIISECFSPEYVAVVVGGREENTALLEEKFDLVFFTGSQAVGKEVLRHAAEHLTPAVLELGGKSPCIVDESADLKIAARRIVFGKLLNCGQTCVAPDYVLVQSSVRDTLVSYIVSEIKRQVGTSPLLNADYGKIINEKHFNRILGLIDEDKVVLGGGSDVSTLKIEPTVMVGVTREDRVMGEEIFGPVLPVLEFDDFDALVDELKLLDKPLALYLFTSDKRRKKRVSTELSYGGGCINDVVIHLATSAMGFGGVGESGMGAYHGKVGFDTFTHYKSIVDKGTKIDLPMRYQPYGNKFYARLIRFFLK